MTAPADAFNSGTDLRHLAPGETFDSTRAKELIPAALYKLCLTWKAGSLRFNAKARVADKEGAAA